MRKADILYVLGVAAVLATAVFWEHIVPERLRLEILAAKAVIQEIKE